jgi:hypothetical protein
MVKEGNDKIRLEARVKDERTRTDWQKRQNTEKVGEG